MLLNTSFVLFLLLIATTFILSPGFFTAPTISCLPSISISALVPDSLNIQHFTLVASSLPLSPVPNRISWSTRVQWRGSSRDLRGHGGALELKWTVQGSEVVQTGGQGNMVKIQRIEVGRRDAFAHTQTHTHRRKTG